MGLHHNLSEDHCRPSRVMHIAVQLALAFVVSALVLFSNPWAPQVVVAQTPPASQAEAPETAQNDATQQDATQNDATQQDATQNDATQQDATDAEEFFGDRHRRQMYEQSKLSTTRAVLYNLALPGMGNLYAEQYFYGGIAFSLMVFTLVFVGYGLATEQPQFLWFGATTAAIAYTGSIATSIYGVREYNEKLRQGLKLEGAFASGPWELPRAKTVDVAIRF